jgi:hypothetical protein
MTIDLERLAVDADYWDEVAPEGATHFMHTEKFVKWVFGVEWVFYASSGREWKKTHCNWMLKQYLNDGTFVLTKPAAPELMLDECLAALIGEAGNQAHNLACEYQNYEDLHAKISKIAIGLWDLANKAIKEPAAPKTQPTDTQPAESGAQISSEWDCEGLPFVGTKCEFRIGGGLAEWHLCTVRYILNGDEDPDADGWRAVVWCPHLDKDQIAYLPRFQFRSIRSQAERDSEELALVLIDDLNALELNISGRTATRIADGIIAAGWCKEGLA